MKAEVLKFNIEDLKEFKEAEQGDRFIATRAHFEAVAKQEHSYTIRINGKVVACAGVVEYWPGRAEAWAIVDALCKKEFYALHNVVKRFLDVVPFKRIEATVCKTYDQGHRWVKLLGFELEAPTLKAYSATGADYSLYARVR